MTTLVENPVVAAIAAWDETSLPAEPSNAAPVVATLTWVQAAVRVLPQDGTELPISDILSAIKAQGLRDMSGAKTPIQTLRRDLNVEARKENARVRAVRKGVYARSI